MKSAQTVYYGPAYSGYPSVGRVSANESVDFLWTEGAWCYTERSSMYFNRLQYACRTELQI